MFFSPHVFPFTCRKRTECVVRLRMVWQLASTFRITRRGQAMLLITSRCLVCINADVSIQPSRPAFRVTSSRRPASVRRYVRYVRHDGRPVVTVVTAQKEHVATLCPSTPLSAKGCTRQVGLTAGIRRVDTRHRSELEITSRAKLVTDLVLYSCEFRRYNLSHD